MRRWIGAVGIAAGLWALFGGAETVAAFHLKQTPDSSTSAQAPPADPQSVVGKPHGRPLAGDELERQTDQTASLLRCPVCQGLSVADSPAAMAVNMKAQVKELLASGYDLDQVLAFFESSYGEFVRLEPPARGVNWLVWLGPVAGLVLGGVIVASVLKRQLSAPTAAAREPGVGDVPPGRDTLPDDPRLAACVLEVREMAYVWTSGRVPRKDA